MRKTLVVGFGEVGAAHANVIARVPSREVRAVDIIPEKVPEAFRLKDENYQPDVLLMAMRYEPGYVEKARGYIEKFKPQMVNVLSTVPPGTCAQIGSFVTHSTTRGLHPHLEDGLLNIVKHVGGETADQMSRFYGIAGIRCFTHKLAKTTEVAHILNNVAYGVNLMLADEMQKMCREYGVDYFQAVMGYTATNNDGYQALDQASKVRMILTPPNGRIGGHCLTHSAGLISPEKRTPLMKMLAEYGWQDVSR
jgi:UDP-N-acetyl-D-mannosaminuronate dehydrogenase